MKCDELIPLVFSLKDFAYIDEPAAEKNFENPHDHAVYKATEVDAAIEELKKKLMPCLNGDCILTCEVVEKYGKENAELKQKLEDAKATAYTESVDAGMRERELKSYKNLECAFSTSSQQEIVVAEDSEGGSIVFEEGDEVYLKSEADKVIAEKDKELAELEKKRDYTIEHTAEVIEAQEREIRHHKFKRCIAMAKICENKLGTVVKPGWWNKWHKRWLELAEKFKPNKSTAQ